MNCLAGTERKCFLKGKDRVRWVWPNGQEDVHRVRHKDKLVVPREVWDVVG